MSARSVASRGGLGVWLHDLAAALRSNWAAPAYSVPAIVSVMLGIGGATTIFALFSAVSLRPLPFTDEGRLVGVFDDRGLPGLEKTVISAPELRDYASMSGTLESLAAYAETEGVVTGVGEAKHVNIVGATSNFFQTLGLQPALGRGFDPANAAEETDSVALVSHTFWMSALGGEEPIVGRSLTVNGTIRTVIGVLRSDEAMPARGDVWIPLKYTAEQSARRGFRFLFAIGRLKGGVTLDAARTELERISLAVNTLSQPPARAVLTPLREELLGENERLVQLMLAAVGVFLLLACANVSSLLLTRASARTHELAVRKALGASPGRLRREAMLEAFVIVVAGASLGTLLSLAALAVLGNVYAELLAYARPAIDGRVLAFLTALSLLTTVVVGWAPAWRASRVSPMTSLRSGGRVSAGRVSRRVREVLVAAQVAACLSLLIATAMLVRSGLALTQVAPGFIADGVVAGQVFLPEQQYDEQRIRQFVDTSLDSLSKIPANRAVAMASQLPLGDMYASRVFLDLPDSPGEPTYAEQRNVSPGYFDALGVPLIDGRSFTARDREGSVAVAIVNRAFAEKLMKARNAVGRRFSNRLDANGDPVWYEVVGVVEDYRDFGLDQPFKPTFFLPLAQVPVSSLAVIVRAEGDVAQLLGQVRQRISSIDANLPLYRLGTLQRALEASYAPRTVLTALLFTIALAALVLASIGLFGVTSYSIYQRIPEFGVRRAIGASPRNIFRLVLAETSLLILTGMVVGGIGAWVARRSLASWLYGVSAADVPSWAIAVTVTFVVSILAVMSPARVAATVSPIVSLKGS